MTADDFDDRVAALEEHLVQPTAEDHLKRAERNFAEGRKEAAGAALACARLARNRELRPLRGDFDDKDDDDA